MKLLDRLVKNAPVDGGSADAADRARRALSPAFSRYLDLVRVAAALTVFGSHLASYPFTRDVRASHALSGLLDRCGNAAVIIFFVLSGYVIAYVTSTRERTAYRYATNRLARLYSVVIPALTLTFVFDSLGEHFNPAFYRISTVMWRPENWAGYLSSLFFLNEFHGLHLNGGVPGSNAPFWSLSFEAAYYLVAGLALFAPRRYATIGVLLTLALAGRTVTALLPAWLLGAAVYHWDERIANIRPPLLAAMAIGSGLVTVSLPTFSALSGWDNWGIMFPWGHGPYNRDLRFDYLVAVTFALNLLAARSLLCDVRKTRSSLDRAVRRMGDMTFPLYAMHYPTLCVLAAFSPFERSSLAGVLFICIGTLSIVAAITPLCDVLKRALRLKSRDHVGRDGPSVSSA